MRRLRAWLQRLYGVFRHASGDREFGEELQGHLAMHVEDNLGAGMTPEEARREALLALGGIAQVTEAYRDRRGVPVLEHLVSDVRYGARALRKNPGFTAVTVLTLALGIGANAAIFSLVNAVLLRPLPFPEAGRLVLVWATNTKSGRSQDVASYPGFEDWRDRSRSFEGLAAFTTRSTTLAGGDQAELVGAVQATPGFLETLGVRPAQGRTLQASDQVTPSVVLLSDRAWKRHFGGRADILGQTLRVNETTCTIVGVMPPDFEFMRGTEIYMPLARDLQRTHGFLRVIGRLRPARHGGPDPGRDGFHQRAARGDTRGRTSMSART